MVSFHLDTKWPLWISNSNKRSARKPKLPQIPSDTYDSTKMGMRYEIPFTIFRKKVKNQDVNPSSKEYEDISIIFWCWRIFSEDWMTLINSKMCLVTTDLSLGVSTMSEILRADYQNLSFATLKKVPFLISYRKTAKLQVEEHGP